MRERNVKIHKPQSIRLWMPNTLQTFLETGTKPERFLFTALLQQNIGKNSDVIFFGNLIGIFCPSFHFRERGIPFREGKFSSGKGEFPSGKGNSLQVKGVPFRGGNSLKGRGIPFLPFVVHTDNKVFFEIPLKIDNLALVTLIEKVNFLASDFRNSSARGAENRLRT